GGAAVDSTSPTFAGQGGNALGGGLRLAGGNVVRTDTLWLDGNNAQAGTSTGTTPGTAFGGGMYVTGITFTLAGSTLNGNFATDGGGGIYVTSNQLTVTNGTLSGNQTNGNGGGLAAGGSAEVRLHNSTVTNNTADLEANGSGDG